MQIKEIKGTFKDASNLNNIPKQTIDLINKFKDIPSGGYEHGDGIKLENGDSFITKSLGENTILMQGKTTDIRYNCYKYRLGKTDEISELNVKNDIIDYYKKNKKILMSPKTHIRIEMIDGVEVRINDDNTIKRNGIDIGNIKDAKEIYVGKYRTSIITQIGTKFIYDNNGNLIKIIPNKDDMGESLKEVFNQADKDFDMYIDARKNTDYSNYIEYLKNDTDKFSLFENIIAYYMVMLDSIGLKDYSNEEKLLYAEEMFNYDRKHGYNMLEKVPIIKNGTVETNVKETEYDYEGDYVYLYNSEGLPKKAPLAVLGTDSNGKLYYDTLESE